MTLSSKYSLRKYADQTEKCSVVPLSQHSEGLNLCKRYNMHPTGCVQRALHSPRTEADLQSKISITEPKAYESIV